MGTGGKSRRAFLAESATGLGVAWVAANYSGIAAAQEFVRSAAASGRLAAYAFFSAEQAAEVEAMAAEIIPTDETPGAREAHVIMFIDRALVTFDKQRQENYREGLEALAAATAKLFPAARRFSALPSGDRVRVLASIEKTPFFELVRVHTITGFFASPLHGGNHDKIGWELVGYDDSLEHTPPFGYYDALPADRS